MTATGNHELESAAFDIVGRVQPITAAEMLASDAWMLYALMDDERAGHPVTMIRHTRHPHVMVVEEPAVVPLDDRAQRAEDPEDIPGPWPDA